jgi:hypothetical protein
MNDAKRRGGRRAWKRTAVVALGLSFGVSACRSGHAPRGDVAKSTASAATTATSPAPASRPVFLRGPTGGNPIAPFVAEQLKQGKETRHGILVYVGATWCEPCQRFHEAVQHGDFDELLSGVRLVEFDLDEDRDALTKAGYVSQLIPLFALPKDDGTASEQHIEGSIKGPSAVAQNLMPRLRAFLRGQAGG